MRNMGGRRHGLLAAACVALLAACSPKTTPPPAPPPMPVRADGAIRIPDRPVPLNPDDPKQTEVDGFRYAGGLWLTSPDTSRLGGLSDLKVAPDGTMISESDEGDLLTARIRLDPQGRLVGLDDAHIGFLRGQDGGPLPSKVEADAEGVALWPNGDMMVSFERDHRIWIYPGGTGRPYAAPMPDEKMPENRGMEGLALAPSQGPDAYWVGIEGGSIWLCRLKAACAKAPGQFPPPLAYRLSALGETPQGDLAVLHHSWTPLTGSRIILSVIENPATHPPPNVNARQQLAPPLPGDKYEGVAAVSRPNGDVRFYLIVDDNFSDKQRSLLLAFDWKPVR